MLEDEYADSRQRYELLHLLETAHGRAARDNSNISSTVAQMAYAGSGSVTQAIVAAIMTTGDLHAPIEEAYYNLNEASDEYLAAIGIVAGFGNSFFKESVDPAFQEVFEVLIQHYPLIAERIKHIQQVAKIEHLFPNAALITAGCLSVLGLPKEMGIALFIKYRVQAWTDLCIGV
jgi:citrate synthase